MKNILLGVIILLQAFSLSAQSDKGFVVDASMQNLPDGKVIFIYRDPVNLQTMHIDSTDAHNGSFQCKGRIPSDEPVFIVLQKPVQGQEMPEPPLRFFIQNGDVITVKGDAKAWDQALATGNVYNQQLNELNAAVNDDKKMLMQSFKEAAANGQQEMSVQQKAMQQQLTDKQKAFLKAHPDYLASAALLYLDLGGALDESQVKEYYDVLTPAVKKSMYGRMLEDRFAFSKKYSSGTQQAVVFSKKDLNGKTINLSDYKGRYVLLDFWGSWCGPCRAGNPHLKELYAQYKDKGFTIIGIANESGTLPEAKAAWKKAVKEDGLPWINVLNEDDKEKFNVTSLYEVGAFPTKILLDKDGKIIGRFTGTSTGNDKDGLTEKLKEVMGG